MSRTPRPSWKRAGLVLLCSLLPLAAAIPAVAGESEGRECRNVEVPVALSEGQPKDQHLYGQLCVPVGETPETIQLLVHGITYTHEYWDFPDLAGGTDRYNYSKAANEAGFATLAIDRIGSGRSSHPLSTRITINSNAFTVHQVVQAINAGQIKAPGGETFDKVVYVGHSYGTWTGWYLATDYGSGIDAAVFTSAFEELTVSAPLLVVPASYPAAVDPEFAGRALDPGYLTSIPGTRQELFYAPAKVDPGVLAYDEAHKSTVTATELVNYPLIVNRELDVRVPVFLVAGTLDSLFCSENFDAVPAPAGGSGPLGSALADFAEPYEDTLLRQSQDVTGSRLGGADCSSAEALVSDEAPHLGPNVPSVDGFVLPGAGHSLNQARNARAYFDAVNTWIADTVGGAA